MIKKCFLILLLASATSSLGSPSPLLPPALYLSWRSHNPVTLCVNASFLFYQLAQALFTAPAPLPTLAPPSHSPDQTVVAFDLHDVMFRPDYMERLMIIAHLPNKWTLFKHVTNPFFLYDLLRLTTQQIAAEQVFDGLIPKYPDLQQFIPSITEMINAQIPIQGTIDVMKTLKDKGFKLYLLSNIGDQILQHMMQKFPVIFSNFDGLFFCSPEYNYIRKPNPQYYHFFFEKFNLKPEQVVFVDDLVKNISAADALGMYGILFHCPGQLERELNTIKIL